MAASRGDCAIRDIESMSGGCIHAAYRVTLDDGEVIAAKQNDATARGMFEQECEGLRALASANTVLVPDPISVTVHSGSAVFLMSYLEPAEPGPSSWEAFGRELAALHQSPIRGAESAKYGFSIDNHIGSTPQRNTWCDSWVEFNRVHRLGYQVELAAAKGTLSVGERKTFESLIDRLDQWIPDQPKPALLHGDLWSGNALSARCEGGEPRIAVIDPAPYVGDGWADIAMMKLFGGFSSQCHRAYAECSDDHGSAEDRIDIYQLYHVLNHVNLFGTSYVGQALAIARGLGV